MTVDEELIRDRLDEVVDPCSAANGTDLSLVEMGLVDEVEVESHEVTVSLRLTSPFCTQIPYFVEEVDQKIGGLDGVSSVSLETDQGMEWHQGMMTESAQARREERIAARAEKLEARSDGTVPAKES